MKAAAVFTFAFVLALAWSPRSCPSQTLNPAAPGAAMKKVEPSITPPPKPIHDVRTYGAKGDAKTYDTVAIQKAIDACAGTGGSVVLANGTFLTAQLTLKGGMTFYIDKSAVLLGGLEPEDYPILAPDTIADASHAPYCRRSVLYATQSDKLILDGGGTIDGQGKSVKMDGKEPMRPSLLRIFQSNDVIVRNLNLKNPRMWTQVYDHCNRLTIDNLTVAAPAYYANLDGLDICDCHDVTIRNCTVDAEDDCICLKTRGNYGLKNITIENNTVHCYHANGFKIGTATYGLMENIQMSNNTVRFALLGGLCLESVDGGDLRNVSVRGLDICKAAQPIFIHIGKRLAVGPSGKPKGSAGAISDVSIENVRIVGIGQTASTITGTAQTKVRNVRLRNLWVELPGGLKESPADPPERETGYPHSNIFGNTPAYAFYVRHAENILFENLSVGFANPDVRPWLVCQDAGVKTINCTDLKQVAHTRAAKAK